MNAPGSSSPSALQQTYFWTFPLFPEANFHFFPVGNPAPPLPLNPESRITWITSSGVISVRHFPRASYPPMVPIYSLDIFRTDESAVSQSNSYLLLIEITVVNGKGLSFFCCFFSKKVFLNNTSLDDMLICNYSSLCRSDFLIINCSRMNKLPQASPLAHSP